MLTNYVRCFLVLAPTLLLVGAIPVEVPSQIVDAPNEQFIQQVHSIFNTYKDESGEFDTRYIIETNARIDNKYRARKRNADLINSLLGLPTGLNDAGR